MNTTKISSQSAATTKVSNNAMVLIAPVAGAVPVAVVRYSANVNMSEYEHANLTSVIPAWKCPDGQVLAIETGKPIRSASAVWGLLSGTVFRFDNGTKILLTRKLAGEREFFFVTGAEAEKNYLPVHRAWEAVAQEKRNWWN